MASSNQTLSPKLEAVLIRVGSKAVPLNLGQYLLARPS